jgi:hypothetical protein
LVQAQDYLGALWAIGLRLPGARESDIEKALAERSILRTWPARGTLHFVAAADVRWVLDLLAPRQMALSTRRLQQLGLDDATISHSRDVLVKALAGGRQLMRDEVYRALEAKRITTEGQRGIHILGRLAQQGLICFGVRRGKQQTFTLLDEWVPSASVGPMPRAQALAELAVRYFSSHGPATLADFAWWSGLTLADVRAGVASAGSYLTSETVDGQTYWQALAALKGVLTAPPPEACLLPGFDEYLVGYQDRSAVLAPESVKAVNAGGGMLNPVIVVEGQVLGTWKRTLKKDDVVIRPAWFRPPTRAQKRALLKAAKHYGAFLGRNAVLT